MKKNIPDEEIEYFVFENPVWLWKGKRELVSKGKKGWLNYGENYPTYNNHYQNEIIPYNIRKATAEEIEFGKKNKGNLSGYKTEQDKKREIDENEKKEIDLLKRLLKKYPQYGSGVIYEDGECFIPLQK